MITRMLTAASFAGDSCFLWGPRQTGKSTLLRTLFPARSPERSAWNTVRANGLIVGGITCLSSGIGMGLLDSVGIQELRHDT
jgi:hypothetical protein